MPIPPSLFPTLILDLHRHGLEDDSLPYAPLVLRHTDRDHRPMFPRSHWRVRVLHLGLVSDRFQAVPFDTSIGIVSVLWL